MIKVNRLVYKVCFMLSIITSYGLKAVPISKGFILPIPNEFWPNHPEVRFDSPPTRTGLGNGTQVQAYGATSNPDIFCKSQLSGYRVPSIFEAYGTIAYPGAGYFQGTPPGHWSMYINNDVNSPLRTEPRYHSGGLILDLGTLSSEWGHGKLYLYSIWSKGASSYWAIEPTLSQTTTKIYDGSSGFPSYTYVTSYSSGRRSFVTGLGAASPVTGTGVVCVRDLVPTPATPNPGRA